MKTTIKLTTTKALHVTPCKGGGLVLEVQYKNDNGTCSSIETHVLTPDQAGALIFGMECALEQNTLANEREGATA